MVPCTQSEEGRDDYPNHTQHEDIPTRVVARQSGRDVWAPAEAEHERRRDKGGRGDGDEAPWTMDRYVGGTARCTTTPMNSGVSTATLRSTTAMRKMMWRRGTKSGLLVAAKIAHAMNPTPMRHSTTRVVFMGASPGSCRPISMGSIADSIMFAFGILGRRIANESTYATVVPQDAAAIR